MLRGFTGLLTRINQSAREDGSYNQKNREPAWAPC